MQNRRSTLLKQACMSSLQTLTWLQVQQCGMVPLQNRRVPLQNRRNIAPLQNKRNIAPLQNRRSIAK
jgi:hypothetical protein